MTIMQLIIHSPARIEFIAATAWPAPQRRMANLRCGLANDYKCE